MKLNKTFFSRATSIVILAALEVAILYMVFRWFGTTAAWMETVLHVVSVFIVMMIIKNSRHLSSDIVWILLIMIMPIAGTAIYLFLGADLIASKTYRSLKDSQKNVRKYLHPDPEVSREMELFSSEHAGEFYYIEKFAGFPFYRNTGFDYYSLGDTGYPAMLEELKKAEKFIFMEYFIIEEGVMWNGILDILKEKAQKGLDVRVIYDDMGSFATLSSGYARRLEGMGIKCMPFNRIDPVLGAVMNHRDHRKITVIDGKTAFSGGINLADEYINRRERFGHWKDNVIRVKGEAVWSFTVLFLTHWNALRQTDSDFEVFKAEADPGEFDGYISPYGETPLDDEITAQNIYMGILNNANRYCYIFTPYLIIDTEMINALILAAKHGVDVRIMTPGIPDKKLVFQITRSYYAGLIEGGVRVFEYTPGFLHSKVFVSDDTTASVGTVNLDYRSLYLHFENSTFLYNSKKVMDVKKDFLDACEVSREVKLEECRYGPVKEFLLAVLRLFAPLM